MPYTWSINNVVMAENLHTALAYWQSGRGDDAFKIWKSTLLDAMYLGSSPGNFVQVEFYDAARGESYRDFADEIGMTSRLLVEGLFGITPNALDGTLTIQPGLPVAWDHAALKIPDFAFDFRRKGNQETYTITQAFAKPMKIKFLAKAFSESVKSVTINGKSVAWTNISAAIEYPQIEVDAGPAANATIVIEWQGNKPEMADVNKTYAKNEILTTSFAKAKMLEVFDPQKTLQGADIKDNKLKATVVGGNGSRTAFVKLSQGQFTWWAPLCFEVRNSLDIVAPVEQKKNSLKFNVLNNTSVSVICKVTVNPGINAYSTNITIKPAILSDEISIPSDKILCGSNLVRVEWGKGNVAEEQVINWDVDSPKLKWETVNLTSSFNDKVTSIFTNKYLSPRSPYPTLSIPIQGIGNWCYTMTMANIDDSGLRKSAGAKNQITTPQGIPFATPGQPDEKNIVFTSLWDNYPAATSIPLTGSASHAYFLMAGSTNPMQSQLSNGEVIIEYTDGSHTSLDLRNPETWWPIEQDYMVDGYAFSLKKPKPIRVHLKTGLMTRDFNAYTTLKGFSTYAIDGGAATIFDLPLDSSRKLKNLILKTLSTEVVVGLMGVTLVRKD
jgi:hypothetical protein